MGVAKFVVGSSIVTVRVPDEQKLAETEYFIAVDEHEEWNVSAETLVEKYDPISNTAELYVESAQ